MVSGRILLLALVPLVHGVMEWPYTCGGCVWEVDDSMVFKRAASSADPCNCGSETLQLKYEDSMDPALAYTSIADNTFSGVTAKNIEIMAIKWGNVVRTDGGMVGPITENMFKGLTITNSYGSLDLTGHSFTSIEANAFDGVKTRTIRLNKNQIAHIDEDAFSTGFDSPGTSANLELMDNKITDLKWKVWADLTNLNLENNMIEGPLDFDLFQGTGGNLLKLDISGSPEIKEITYEALDTLTSLEQLKLTNTGLTSVNADWFTQTTLKDKLERLHLDNNEIEEITSDMFSALSNLEILKLGKNKIKEVPAAFTMPLTKLTALYLNDNMIEEIPVDIWSTTAKGGPDNPYDFDVSNNRLTTLPVGIFEGMTGLDNIALAGNYLRSLPVGLIPDMFYTGHFNLNGNFFEGPGLAEALGPYLDDLDYPELYNNPWKCRPDFPDTIDDTYEVDDWYLELPTCEAFVADKCTGVCDELHKPKETQTPDSCPDAKCEDNDANCCEPLPACKCKEEWYNGECDSYMGRQKGCPKEACSRKYNINGDPWCVVANAPCAGMFAPGDEVYDIDGRNEVTYGDDRGYWASCGMEYLCTNPCCRPGTKSKGVMIKVGGFKKTPVPDIDACYELCKATAGCAVWEYKTTSSECKLRADESKKVDEGRNSGNLWKEQDPRIEGTLTFGQNKGQERPDYRPIMKTIVGAADCNPRAATS